MAKWQLTGAAAKRIFMDYIEDDSPGGSYDRLKRRVEKDGQCGHNAMGYMLCWICREHPDSLPLLLEDLAFRHEQLRKKTEGFLDAFEALSSEVDYKHYHEHDEEV